MTTVVCPQCSCRQPAGDECRICHARLPKIETPANAANAAAAAPESAVPAQSSPAGVLRHVWRISNWVTLAALLVVAILVMRPAPAPVIPKDPQAAVRAQTKVRDSLAAASNGQPIPLRLDQAELNAFLASNLGLAGSASADAAGDAGPAGSADDQPSLDQVRSNVKDVKVTMRDDRVQAYVLFDFHGKDLTLVLEGRLGAKDGYLRFEPTSGKLGSLPIPQSTLEGAVARMFDSPENRDKLRLPKGVGDVRIGN